MARWESPVYTHFKSPPKIEVSSDGVVKYVFQCISYVEYTPQLHRLAQLYYRHPSVKPILRKREDTSTGNLDRHVKGCAPPVNSQTDAIKKFMHGSTYSKSKFRYLLDLWIVRRHRPYAIVEDPELIELFRMLFAQVEIPSARTISRDVQELYQMAKVNMIKMLQVRCLSSVLDIPDFSRYEGVPWEATHWS